MIIIIFYKFWDFPLSLFKFVYKQIVDDTRLVSGPRVFLCVFIETLSV